MYKIIILSYENSLDVASSQDLNTYSAVDNISFLSTELLMDDLMKIIDSETN